MSKEILRKLKEFSEQRASKDWSHKIIAKHREGERVQPIALEFALEALGIGRKSPEREPGSDDE